MLVLSRKRLEKVMIGDTITVCVLRIHGGQVQLGIDAPPDVKVHRREVWLTIPGNGPEEGDAPEGGQRAA